MAPRKSSSTTKPSQTQPEKTRTSVPPPQAARIAARFVSGESMRKIAREEKRDRETVRRVLKTEDIQLLVEQLRVKYFALGSAALDAVQHQLSVNKNSRLGMEILTNIGVVPSKRELFEMLHRDEIELPIAR